VGAVVVIVKRTTGSESERLLDELERATNVVGERLERGRRYTLLSAADWDAGVKGLSEVLDRLSETWPIHLGFEKTS
jgi:hypothetical protein